MKYTDIQSSLYSVFASSEWESEDIVTVPNNFTPKDADNYIRVTIIPGSDNSFYTNMDAINGLVLIDIFTQHGEGPNRIYQISDALDKHLQGKTVDTIQLKSSSLSMMGRDRDNTNLHRAIYTIPFSYFGV